MRRFLAIFLFLFCCTLCFAAPPNGASSGFDIKNANKQFDRINLQLSVQNLNLTHLVDAVNTLTELVSQANDCVEESQKKQYNIEMLIKQDGGLVENKKEGADLVYLDKQKKEYADRQAQCRLFSIRAQEAIGAYQTAIAQFRQNEALTRGMPLWDLFSQVVAEPPKPTFLDMGLIKAPNVLYSLLIWIGFIGLAFMAATLTLHKIQHNRHLRHYLRFKKMRITHVFLLSIFFLISGRLIYLLSFPPTLNNSGPSFLVIMTLFCYLAALMAILLVFKMKRTRAFFYWYSLDPVFFQSLIIALTTLYTTLVIGHAVSNDMRPSSLEWQLFHSLFLLTTLAIAAYFTYRFCHTHRHVTVIKRHHRFIQRLALLLLIACAMIGIMGYHILAHAILVSGFFTCVIIIVTLLMTHGIKKTYVTLCQQPTTKTRVMKYFGYREDQPFTEFLILKVTLQLIVITISVYLIGQSIGFATDIVANIYNKIIFGIHFANAVIYPTRIISGVLVFCLLYLVFRAISTALSRRQQFENEEETQVAIASILTYIGFGIALIAGLLVAGFNFTGLTIIAGALSVGIGLGLQSIVNNFVSGLILLIEKPIRPGDRISIDGVEGFVKKIRVRSTQIITPAREDIIIPNADLISKRVTNFMFSDKYCRIHCDLEVAYGSDTDLVREVLLNIANNHEEIIKLGRNKPIVLFLSFKEKTLVFQLSCLIKDVNKKMIVQSELNYAINQAFSEHKIWT